MEVGRSLLEASNRETSRPNEAAQQPMSSLGIGQATNFVTYIFLTNIVLIGTVVAVAIALAVRK